MTGEKDLEALLRSMKPVHHPGEFVFCVIEDVNKVGIEDVILFFREDERFTVILEKSMADHLQLSYSFIASWISLTIHSSLEAVGFTAAFSTALSDAGISCNVVAAYYHDHIFVSKKDTERALIVLSNLAAR